MFQRQAHEKNSKQQYLELLDNIEDLTPQQQKILIEIEAKSKIPSRYGPPDFATRMKEFEVRSRSTPRELNIGCRSC